MEFINKLINKQTTKKTGPTEKETSKRSFVDNSLS